DIHADRRGMSCGLGCQPGRQLVLECIVGNGHDLGLPGAVGVHPTQFHPRIAGIDQYGHGMVTGIEDGRMETSPAITGCMPASVRSSSLPSGATPAATPCIRTTP